MGKSAVPSPTSKPRTTSKLVQTSPACAPLKKMYAAAVQKKPKSWTDIEDDFLRAMEGFDDNVVAGKATQGDRQNGKGDFLNDLLALILESCSGIGTLYTRGDVPGLIIPRHKLDVTYPPVGIVEFMLEAKAVGTPKHPRSQRQKDCGRPGSADLDKRIKEVGFKAIDIKAEYGRQKTKQGAQPTVTGDLTTWLRAMKPRSYVFISARVVSDSDLARVIGYANVATLVNDFVGLYCYRPVRDGKWTRYRSEKVPPTIEMERVLYRVCTDLVAIKDVEPEMPVEPSLAETVENIPVDEDVGDEAE
jgi:hypothetical protein